MKKVLAIAALVIAMISAGCIGTLSEMMAPGRTDQDAINYVKDAGLGDGENYKNPLGYSSLADVKRLEIDLKAAIALTDQELKQLAETKHLKDQILTNTVTTDLELATANHDFLFNAKTGLVSLGILGLGTFGAGYLGLTRKRSGDITQEDAEAEKADAVSTAVKEAEAALQETISALSNQLKIKTTAVTQLVGNIQTIIDTQPSEDAAKQLIKQLKDGQLPETRKAVKEAQATL